MTIGPDHAEVVLEREDEDDYDLLTYGEVGARVTQGIADSKARVAELEQSHPSVAGVAERLEVARRRLALLRDAADRNRRQPITQENFEKFFGYEGTARRNT